MKREPPTFNRKESFLLGIDIGTSACKISLVSTATLKAITLSSPYQLLTPKPLWVELDPDIILTSVFNLTRKLLGHTRVRHVEGVGLGGLVPSLVPVDGHGKPLLNCLANMDKRAYLESRWIEKKIGRERLYGIVYRSCLPKFVAPKILWVKKNYREIYDKTCKFLQIKDLLAYHLCGVFSTDSLLAGNTLLFDQNKGEWSRDLMKAMGINGSKLPPLYSPMSILGKVTRKASRLTGLKEGTPVVCGANDDALASLAIGALNQGTAFETTGTSTVFSMNLSTPLKDPLQRFEMGQGLKPDTYNISFVNQETGAIIKWLIEALSNTEKSKQSELEILEWLETKAQEIGAGSEGLIILPFFEGMGSGIHDMKAKGVIFGLTLRHSKAHIYRAVLEGIALRLKENAEILKSFGINAREVRITGGGAKSRLSRQIKADVLGLPYILTDVEEAASVGAAIIAGGGIGIYADPYSIGEKHARTVDTTMPRREFKSLYDRMARVSHKLTECLFSSSLSAALTWQ